MEWLTLLLLALCPLMMIFCMRGMFGSKHKKHQSCGTKASKDATAIMNDTNNFGDLKDLQVQMAELMEENRKLKTDIDEIKALKSGHFIELKHTRNKIS